jgi:hypothetical protein
MCALGLNDIIYLMPEYSPKDYHKIYPKQPVLPAYDNFFERYCDFGFFPDEENLPDCLGDLDKALCTAIEPDLLQPKQRGKAYVNIKHVPNGHYSLYYLRIGQPLSIDSKLKILGKNEEVYINLDRSILNESAKPQLDVLGRKER